MNKIVTALLVVLCLNAQAQNDNALAREGNGNYRAAKYDVALDAYTKSLSANPDQFETAFNLGDALYRQEKYEEAASHFDALAKGAPDKESVARSYHNMGNSLLKKKDVDGAIQAYQKSLMNNPSSEDTRYNLAYAKKLKKQQEEQEKSDENKDDQENEDKENEDKQDQDKKEDQKQDEKQENQDKQDEQKKDQQQDKPKPDQNPEKQEELKMDKASAERMLDALNNEEKAVQLKLKKKGQSQKMDIEKDW